MTAKGFEDLQKALKKFPRHGLAKEERDQCPICVEQEKWHRKVTDLFSAFKVAYEGQVQKLNQFRQDDLKVILDEIDRGCYKTQKDILFEVIRVFDEAFLAKTPKPTQTKTQ